MANTLSENFGLNPDGFIFPKYSDFINIFNERGKIEYGDDFLIDTETGFGQLIDVLAYIYEGFSGMFENIYNSFFLYGMQGQMLDRFAANFYLERLQGTNAYGYVELKGTPGYVVPRGFLFKSKRNLFYSLVSNTAIDSTGNARGQVVAQDIGSLYNTDANTITEKATGDINVASVNNADPITNGTDLESDYDFRIRLSRLFQGNNNASVNGIKKAMLELNNIQDAKVIENNTNETDTETGLEPGEICVILKGLVDNEAAEKLFNTRSAGIRTVGNVTIPLTSESGQRIFERLYNALEKILYIKVSEIELYENTSLNKTDTIVSELMLSIPQSLTIGEKANYEKIQAVLYNIPEIEEAKVEISLDGVNWQTSDINITVYEYLTLLETNIIVVEA